MNGTKVVSVCWKTFALPTMTNYSIASNNNNNHKKKKREERKKNERDKLVRFRVLGDVRPPDSDKLESTMMMMTMGMINR